jgi:D-inositol-3-phosphate glycosyltransferase
VRRLAVLSLHTSPLAQPGLGDGGGMNVYVRSLSSALARAGVECDVFTRAWQRGLPAVVDAEPGLRVHHVPMGPPAPMSVEEMAAHVDEFTDGVLRRLQAIGQPDALHANYWLSGLSGHVIKHELSLPLVSTFHTLARVKAEADEREWAERACAEAQIVGCSDAILASGPEEAAQLERLYDAVADRVELVPPGVDHDLFCPGDRRAARQRLRLGDEPVVLFVGRIQPLKGLAVAVQALAHLDDDRAVLVVVGGPSGPDGEAEVGRVRDLVRELGLRRRVRFVPPQRHASLAAYYRVADVCIVPSRSESFGLVALEAAACGTPVVAAAVGGLRTIVEHGRTGFLVEGRNPAAYAAYVNELLANPLLAAEMSVNAAARSGRFSWPAAAARLRRLYGDLAARHLVECR